MRHLDAAAMRELAGRDPEAVAWFREHLASPCVACETFLADHADALDGPTDALLLALAPAREAEATHVVPLRTPPRPGRLGAPPGRYWGWMVGAVAASLLMVVLVPRFKAPSPTGDTAPPGVKGAGTISLELAVVARDPGGALRRVDPDADVHPDEVLLVRYHATESGTGLLFQQRKRPPAQLLGIFPLEAGTHDLEGPQGLTGVSLEADEGPLSLVLMAFAAGEAPSEEVARAALGETPALEARPGAVIRFDVRVRSGQTSAPP